MKKVYQADSSKPTLPIASFADCCNRYRSKVDPLAKNESEKTKTLSVIDDFQKTQSWVHEALEAYQKNLGANHSYFRSTADQGYLGFRGSIAKEVNYSFKLTDGVVTPGTLIVRLTKVAQLIGSGELEPEREKSGEALYMGDLRNTFYTRIPSKTYDWLKPIALDAPLYAVVICEDRYFRLPLTNASGQCYSSEQIEKALAQIREEATKRPACKVGRLTATKRDHAHDFYSELQKSGQNIESFNTVQNALFVIALDKAIDIKKDPYGVRQIHYGVENRWYDKSTQLIITDDGTMGINNEHSGCDASVWAYVYAQMLALPIDDVCKDKMPFYHVDWQLTPEQQKMLEQAETSFVDSIKGIKMAQAIIPKLSRDEVKKIGRPNNALLALIPAAQFAQTKNDKVNYYAPAATRAFYEGRTAPMRPISSELQALLNYSGSDEQELKDLFAQFSVYMDRETTFAQMGEDGERQFSAYKKMFLDADKELHPIFSDPIINHIGYDDISTSSMGLESFIDFFNFGPVVSGGVAVGNFFYKKGLSLSVASENANIDPQKFIDDLTKIGAKWKETFSK